MSLIACPSCSSHDIDGEALDDGRIRVLCTSCGHVWLRGEAKRVYRSATTIHDLRRQFPSPDDVLPEVRLRVEDLKQQFLVERPEARPEVLAFWSKYAQLFSEQGLGTADPQDLKDFANSNVGANPGNMSVFNTEWNTIGDAEAAARTADSIRYLLYGPEGTYLEDRLTQLIEGDRGLGMTGFREALLTKVLCVVYPERFLPIVKYTGVAGKKEIAERVFDLRLPDPESTSFTIGRLVIWSNDLLMELVGDLGHNTQASQFLWWAKDQA